MASRKNFNKKLYKIEKSNVFNGHLKLPSMRCALTDICCKVGCPFLYYFYDYMLWVFGNVALMSEQCPCSSCKTNYTSGKECLLMMSN